MIVMNTNKLEINMTFCPKWTSVLRELIAMDYFDTLEKNEGKGGMFKDRHQWWGREFRRSLLSNMDKLFPKAIIYVLYH